MGKNGLRAKRKQNENIVTLAKKKCIMHFLAGSIIISRNPVHVEHLLIRQLISQL